MTQPQQQIDLEQVIPDPLVSVTYKFPKSQQMVHDAAHELISLTMEEGAATNGLNTWINRDKLYHLNKGMLHVLGAWHKQSIEARESEPPHMLDIGNAITRLSMEWALHKMKNRLRERNGEQARPHEESIEE